MEVYSETGSQKSSVLNIKTNANINVKYKHICRTLVYARERVPFTRNKHSQGFIF